MKRKIWTCTNCELEFDYEFDFCIKCHNPYYKIEIVEEYEI